MDVPPGRFDSALEYFNGYEITAVAPGLATVGELVRILIPFDHYLRKATVGGSDTDVVGVLTVKVMAAAPGAAKAGVQVGTTLSSATDFVQTANLNVVNNVVLSNTDQGTLRVAGTVYCIQLQGTNAGDLWKTPMLTVGVEPVSRSRL